MSQADNLTCTFCNRHNSEVKKLIAGPNVHICNECVELCNEILIEEKSNKENPLTSSKMNLTIPDPRDLFKKLSEHIIGQEAAKKSISVAIFKHYYRILHTSFGSNWIPKENILLIGPTGSGKTLFFRALSRILDVPVAIADATALTEAGYVGEDVQNVISYLLIAAKNNLDLAQKGILYIDEIDKKSRKSVNPSITRDVSGEGVQQALLNMLGGGVVRIDPNNNRKHPKSELTDIDTNNILFICGGAFDGIENIVKARLKKQFASTGQSPPDSADLLRFNVTQVDLEAYGIIPELASRFTTIIPLVGLREPDLVRILTDSSQSPLKQYEMILASEGIKLSLTDDAAKSIACEAIADGSGARGLKRHLDRAMIDTLFEIPSKKKLVKECVIDKESITGIKPPALLDKKGDRIPQLRSKVFISYSHNDLAWADEIRLMLSPVTKDEVIDVWIDKSIKPSQHWRDEIEIALASAKVAVLLVSPNFLASEFIANVELPYLLNAAKSEGVSILWVLVSHCMHQDTKLTSYQCSHDPSRPLDTLTKAKRREVILSICQHVKTLAAK